LKILFTQDALVNAGAERSHLEILSRFSSEVDVGFVYFYPKHELKEAYEGAGIRLFFLDIPESYHFPLAIFRLVKLIRTEKPDLLISSLWRADMITRIASLITGVPLVGTLVNDSYAPIAWTDKKGMKYKLIYWLDRLTAGIPVHWIANAQALADSHLKTLKIEPERISVVYRGRPVIAGDVIESAAASPEFISGKQSPADKTASSADNSSEKAGSIESSLAVTGATDDVIASDAGAASPELDSGKQSFQVKIASPADCVDLPMKDPNGRLAMKRNFISYGRLLERKGFQDAIKAFSEVIKQYPDCTLTIFGEGPYRTQLESLIQALGLEGSVFLPGKVTNPMDALINGYFPNSASTSFNKASDHCLLTTANFFLFPSWYEGFSGALVEAMMAGIPIIASDIPMNLEAVSHGKTALTFKVGNSQDLLEKMKFAIEHPEEMVELGKQARREAEERFDIEKIAWEYEGVVKRIAPPRPSP
jgi:glycosyltransferase involved in cell wall biosynthesis